MTSLKTSIKTITYLSDTGCLEIQGASLGFKESEGTTGVYRDDEKIIRLYTGVSSGKDVPVMMTVRFTGCDGSVLSESSHGTFCSVGPTGRVQVCDRVALVQEAVEELRDVV